jgi:hypothetical protein
MKKLLLAIVVTFLSSLTVPASMFDKVTDFDGDGKADYAVTRNVGGQKIWYLSRSTAGFAALAWGIDSDTVVAGDYDGDGRTDIAVARLVNPGGGMIGYRTYYLASSNGAVGTADIEAINIIGSGGPSNQDYDGDGRTDAAMFQWHSIGNIAYRNSSSGTVSSQNMTWFLVRVGDLNGDNSADVASYNPGSGELFTPSGTVRWGVPGDRFVAADFDGDNKGDIAIFRQSSGDWWWIRTSDFVVNAAHWGVDGDIPVQADYDGDSRTDLAVYRPASPQSIFYVYGSTTGFSAIGFGVASDAPVAY